MKILVPGGHGFVGKEVVALLAKTPHQVLALSRRDGFDLRDFPRARDAIARFAPEVIVNCAAHVGSLHYITEKAADVIDDNLQIILGLYRAAREVCPGAKIINPISNCSYPGDANIQVEGEWWDGPVHKSVWSYANSRRMIGVVSECYAMQAKLRTVNFLVPNAYGPGDYVDPNRTHALNGMIIRMMQAHRAKAPSFEVWGTGTPRREWIFVRDIARILVSAIDAPDTQVQPVNVAQNKAYSIRENAEMIKAALGFAGELVFNTKYQDGAPIKQLDDKLFREKYPSFEFTPIDRGVRETVEYYQTALAAAQRA